MKMPNIEKRLVRKLRTLVERLFFVWTRIGESASNAWSKQTPKLRKQNSAAASEAAAVAATAPAEVLRIGGYGGKFGRLGIFARFSEIFAGFGCF